jgi:hypothetical protein
MRDSRSGELRHRTSPARPYTWPALRRRTSRSAHSTLFRCNHTFRDRGTPNDSQVSLHTPRACPLRNTSRTGHPCKRLRTSPCLECNRGTTPHPRDIAPRRRFRLQHRSRPFHRSRPRRFRHPYRRSRPRWHRRCPRSFRDQCRPSRRYRRLRPCPRCFRACRLLPSSRHCPRCHRSSRRTQPSFHPTRHRRSHVRNRPARPAGNPWPYTRRPPR